MAAPIIQFKRVYYNSYWFQNRGEPSFTTDKYDLAVGLTSELQLRQFFGSGNAGTERTRLNPWILN